VFTFTKLNDGRISTGRPAQSRSCCTNFVLYILRRVKWRHSNLWSQYDLYVAAYCVKLSGEDFSRYSDKIEPVPLRRCSYYHYFTYSNKYFSQHAPVSWRGNSWHRYGTKKLRHCHPAYCNLAALKSVKNRTSDRRGEMAPRPAILGWHGTPRG